MTYDEMMEQLKLNHSNCYKRVVGESHKWNYDEPYKMVCLNCEEETKTKVELTFAFKVDEEFVQKKQTYILEGKALFYWKQFISDAFPNIPDDFTADMLIGRPFVAEIVKNGSFDNVHVLSGYSGDFSEVVEGL